MKIYFENDKLQNQAPAFSNSTHKCYIVNAGDGYSRNVDTLDILLGEEISSSNEVVVYTNSLFALSNKYCWNKELSVPELYIRPEPGFAFVRVDELTDKEIRKAHNLMQMYMNGAFKYKE